MRQVFITSKYKKFFQKSLLVLLLSYGQNLALGQNWLWIQQFGTSQSETVDAMQTDSEGNIYLSGKFKDSFDWNTTTLESIGKDDIYLTKLDDLGNPIWARRGGSTESDESIAIAIDGADNLYHTGHYWFAADFGFVNLTAAVGSRAIFVVKYDAQGNVLWGKSIDGTAGKTVSSCVTDGAGNLYLSGSFRAELQLEDTTLTASPQGDIFVAKLSPAGELLWVQQAKASVAMKAVTMTLSPSDEVIVAGQFIGAVDFASDSFVNITGDNDVFLLKYDTDGNPLWGRKAGGVLEDDCSQVRTDADGNVFLTGTFIGVLELSEDLQIQTNGLNNNFYLLKYTSAGDIVWARSLGGAKPDAAEDLIVNGSMIVVAGYFAESMSIDGISVTSNSAVADAFIAAFDLDGKARKIQTISSEGFVIPNNLHFTATGEILSSGVFEANTQFGAESLTSQGLFDIYLARLGDDFTSVKELDRFRSQFRLFPNPSTGRVFIDAKKDFVRYEIYDALGRLQQRGGPVEELNLTTWQAGIYFIRLINEAGLTASFAWQKY